MTRPVLITGCSSGIGLVTARYLAERDVPVYATVRSEADAARVDAIDGVTAFVCDVTDGDQVAALRAQVDALGAGLHGLVHNAGVGYVGRLTETPLDHLRAVLEVNVVGVHRLTNAMVDLIVASRGRIVTMSSIMGTLSNALMGAYSMSKHALEAYTDTLAKQLAPNGVHVCAIAPGNFASEIAVKSVQRFVRPGEASAEVMEIAANVPDTERSPFPSPEPVAAACFAALFDDAPLARYLVVGNADEADRTLGQAALEWARMNVSTPHRWTLDRLAAEAAAHAEAAEAGGTGAAARGPLADEG